MRYNIEDMVERSARLEELVEGFISEFIRVTADMDWEGQARNCYDEQISNVAETLRKLAVYPREKAEQVQETDHRLAEMIYNKYM